jgi:DNA-nicking Smr family endonuclease
MLRRIAAVELATKNVNYLSEEIVERIDPFEIIAYKRDGVQHGVFKKLKKGRYDIDAKLDLHKLTVAKAREEVFGFIAEAVKYDLRMVMILHGKGDRNPEDPALLKSYTAKWLTELPDVLAYHSAQQRDGGTGAVYVLLKKSERLKRQNRERLGLGD